MSPRKPKREKTGGRKREIEDPVFLGAVMLEREEREWLKEHAKEIGVPSAALVRSVLRRYRRLVIKKQNQQ